MRSITTFILAAFLASAVQASAESKEPLEMLTRFFHEKNCSPSKAGGCGSCGADYVQCGSDACYNPKAGETCCENQYACPANFNCSSTVPHCLPNKGPDCDGEGGNHTSSIAAAASTTSSIVASITTGSPVAAVAATSGSDTTSYMTTVTSTTTMIVTVSATSDACGLSAATTGLPLTTPVPYGNSTTVALNTTTSTLSVTNVTVHPATNYSISKPTASINPPISGYKGVASGIQGHSSTSLFALGCLIFMAALLV